MRHKIIIPLLLATAAVIWYLIEFHGSNSTIEQPVQKTQAEHVTTLPQASENKDSVLEVRQQTPQPHNKELDQDLVTAIELLEEQRYSIDPLVELFSIRTEYSNCSEMVKNYKTKDVIITTKRASIIGLHEKRCDALKQKYPFISDSAQIKKISKHLRQQDSLTALGDLYRENNKPVFTMDVSAELNRLTQIGVSEKNSQVLVQNVEFMSMPFFKPDKTISEILGGLDENYFRLIQNHAMSLLSCRYQGGVSCLPESDIMRTKCMENEDYCGLNFSEWYQQYTTEGQKLDVEKLISFYEEEK